MSVSIWQAVVVVRCVGTGVGDPVGDSVSPTPSVGNGACVISEELGAELGAEDGAILGAALGAVLGANDGANEGDELGTSTCAFTNEGAAAKRHTTSASRIDCTADLMVVLNAILLEKLNKVVERHSKQ